METNILRAEVLETAVKLKAKQSRWVNALVILCNRDSRLDFLPRKNFKEELYLFMHNISAPLCNCGKRRNFLKWYYQKTCGSKECIGISKIITFRESGAMHHTKTFEHKAKMRQLSLERTGYEHNFKNPESRKKATETLIERTGYAHALQNPDSVKKREITLIQKLGTTNMFSQGKDTMLERWGVTNAMHNESIKNRVSGTMTATKRAAMSESMQKINKEYVSTAENGWVNMKCNVCGFESSMPNSSMNSYIRSNNDPCQTCNPPVITKGTSGRELEILEFVKSLDDKIRHRWYNYNAGELDIFSKERNIGIEFNGLWWHNELHIERNYHVKKSSSYLELGVKVFHVWEDDWVLKREIVKSRIEKLMGASRKIYARSCTVKKISSKMSKDFIEKYHIQGNVNSSQRFGLFFGDELLQVMTFSKPRGLMSMHGEKGWELLRFASKFGISVIGGASKLFVTFLRDKNPEEVFSFCDIGWTPDPENAVYRRMGFELESRTLPNYYYVINGVRHSRMSFTKKQLIKEGYDARMTEHEIMLQRKFYRVYDLGNWKFRWKKASLGYN